MTELEPTKYMNPLQIVTDLLYKYLRAKVEYFGFIAFDKANHVLKVKELFKGGISVCTIDIKTVYWSMLKYPLSSVIFFHNHPSGNATPSEPDKDLCRSLEQGCRLLGVQLLDNIIVSRYGYTSFREEDLLIKEKAHEASNICT